ncbi:MAG: FkbM family methyltransferase [Syntrophobacteraceae bacterium]
MNEVLKEINKRSKSRKEADSMPSVFANFRREAEQGRVPVVIFGAGSAGKDLYPVLKLHGVDPVCFCDNNPARFGQFQCGLPVISVGELILEHRDSLIVVAVLLHSDSVEKQLVGLGFQKDRILQKPLGLWSHSCKLQFADGKIMGPESGHPPQGGPATVEIATTSIDEELRDEPVTIIKMDVEGAEMEALRGAAWDHRKMSPQADIECLP